MVVECSHQWLLLLLDAVQGCFVGVEIHAQLPPKTSPKVAQFTVSADCNAINDQHINKLTAAEYKTDSQQLRLLIRCTNWE